MPQTIHLVSGSNRGIGLAIVKELLKQPEAIVFAGAREPSKAAELQQLAADNPAGRFHIVKLVSADEESNKAAAQEIHDKYGRVDTVIANAGIGGYRYSAGEIATDRLRDFYEVNVVGPLVLFQATLPLLKKGQNPRFVPISSGVASTTRVLPGFFSYGSSKAALNYLAVSIHVEYDWLLSFSVSPGVVLTDMALQVRASDPTGKMGERQDAMAIPAEECASKILALVSGATREQHGGKFISYDGTAIPR